MKLCPGGGGRMMKLEEASLVFNVLHLCVAQLPGMLLDTTGVVNFVNLAGSQGAESACFCEGVFG